jgi:hypothetical protein
LFSVIQIKISKSIRLAPFELRAALGEYPNMTVKYQEL